VRSDHRHANSFRIAPSLCADMIFGKDRVWHCQTITIRTCSSERRSARPSRPSLTDSLTKSKRTTFSAHTASRSGSMRPWRPVSHLSSLSRQSSMPWSGSDGGKFLFQKLASRAWLGMLTPSISAAGQFMPTHRLQNRLPTKSAMLSPRGKRRSPGRREPVGPLCAWGARATARRWTSRSTQARSVGIASTGNRIDSRVEDSTPTDRINFAGGHVRFPPVAPEFMQRG
jgi:hypothetical protein